MAPRRRLTTTAAAVVAVAAVAVGVSVGLGERDGPAPSATGDTVAQTLHCADAAGRDMDVPVVYLPCTGGSDIAPVARPGVSSVSDAVGELTEGPTEAERGLGYTDWAPAGSRASATRRGQDVHVDVRLTGTTVAPQFRAAAVATVTAWTGVEEDGIVFSVNGSCAEWQAATGTVCSVPATPPPAVPTSCEDAPDLPACRPGEGVGG